MGAGRQGGMGAGSQGGMGGLDVTMEQWKEVDAVSC
jgi:hypothetical protein